MSKRLTLERIKRYIDKSEYAKICELADELLTRIQDRNLDIEKVRLLVGFGGGKDSSWTISIVRIAQLICFEKTGKTFGLDSITMVHLGMSKHVLENIHKAYSALDMYNKENIRLIAYSYGYNNRFDINFTIPERIINLLREDILTLAHRSYADARTTFCYTCNFHMINSFLANLTDDTLFFLSGDSEDELKNYEEWTNFLFDRLEINSDSSSENNLLNSIHKFLILEEQFYGDVFPEDAKKERLFKKTTANISPFISYINISEYTRHEMDAHKVFLTKFLKFQFHKESFNFSESDCIHPLFMAHLRGLSAEINGRSYKDGINDYLKLAKKIMESKKFPSKIIQEMIRRYKGSKMFYMRKRAAKILKDVLKINENQIICAIYSPFANKGQNLKKYFTEVHPNYKNLDLVHEVLRRTEIKPDYDEVIKFLELISGLNISYLKKIYHSSIVSQDNCDGNSGCILRLIKEKEPHQHQIQYEQNGQKIVETITGR